jgi:GT2 family glycosyltransferase
MKLSAIIPLWNGRELVERLLTSLESQTAPAEEIIAVDNGSTDGAPEAVARRGARVIAMGRNAGFAAAVNRGIGECRGEWIAVVNSDVELGPDYFAALLAAAESEQAWFATGKLLAAGAEGTLDGAFDAVCGGGTACRVGNGRPDGPLFGARRRIWSAPWTAAIFRAELFRRAGLLEESFESYLEDVDFGLRCASQGLAGIYEPAGVAWHRGSATLGRWHPETVRRMARNQVLLVARHYPRETLRANWWGILVAHALWGGLALRHGAGAAWLRGKWQGLRGVRRARQSMIAWEPCDLEAVLAENERAIREFQGPGGGDAYWGLYFLLTRSEAK